jgi:hypothetical protein
MALTRDFKETIRVRVQRDPGFRKALSRMVLTNLELGLPGIGNTESDPTHG